MNKSLPRKLFLGITAFLLYTALGAQERQLSHSYEDKKAEAEKRIDDYLKLFKLGYTEREIFEDLGNVNFLIENFDTAVFWYEKLLDLSGDEGVHKNYYERYQFAMQKAGLVEVETDLSNKDWMAMIKEDYQVGSGNTAVRSDALASAKYDGFDPHPHTPVYTESDYSKPNDISELAYNPPMSVTADGKTAYFTKALTVKPLYGLFSKKQTVYKIFKAEKRNGAWKNIKQLAVCPKYASATHPAVSPDGTRLFFASDMPGTFGKYDIYVSEIQPDGSMGIAKNLGEKVNTPKNDLYPNIIEGTMLTFASDGRQGRGGLDLYAVKVGRRNLSQAVNLGAPFNSTQDDFSIALSTERGMGYVMSNRGSKKHSVQQIAFTYDDHDALAVTEIAEDEFLEILNSNLKTGYSNTVYDDPEP